jgi:dolichol-phosphate mannosyltransferase
MQLAIPLPAAELAAAATGAAALSLGTAFFVLPERGQRPAELRWRMAALGIFLYSAMLRLAYLAIVPPLPGEGAALATMRLANWLLWFPFAATVGVMTGLLHGKSAGLRAVLLVSLLPWFFFAGFAARSEGMLVALFGLLFASMSLAFG